MKTVKKNLYLLLLTVFIITGYKNRTEQNDLKKIANNRPNIILIVTDDMGWHDLGIYGNEFIETPNLDKLANRGLMFTNAYAAAPLCSPSRASLITGLHPVRVNITEHIHGNAPAGPKQKLKTPSISQQLDLEYETIAEVLKEKKYRTGFIGKWHLGGGKYEPQHQGFDINIGGGYHGLPNSFFYPFFGEGEKPEIQNDSQEGDYLTDVLTDKALAYITENQGNSFFLNLNYYSPHVPIEGKESLVKKYLNKKRKNPKDSLPNAHYAAMVESIDINVGRILKKLEELDLDTKTLVIFTSDNGGLSVEEVPRFAKHTPPTDNGPLRDGKGYLYEGGIKVPLIISWPNKIKNSDVIEEPVIAQDFFNTITEATCIEKKTKDGVSLIPYFEGRNPPKRGLLWHLPHYSPQKGKPVTAYRNGDWKILYFYEDDRYELYNLKKDDSERNDLSNQKPEILAHMKNDMESYLKELGAKFPEENPNYIPD